MATRGFVYGNLQRFAFARFSSFIDSFVELVRALRQLGAATLTIINVAAIIQCIFTVASALRSDTNQRTIMKMTTMILRAEPRIMRAECSPCGHDREIGHRELHFDSLNLRQKIGKHNFFVFIVLLHFIVKTNSTRFSLYFCFQISVDINNLVTHCFSTL